MPVLPRVCKIFLGEKKTQEKMIKKAQLMSQAKVQDEIDGSDSQV